MWVTFLIASCMVKSRTAKKAGSGLYVSLRSFNLGENVGQMRR